MTDFEIGDVVYIKDEIVEIYKKYAEQDGVTALAIVQIGLAKDIPFTIIHIDDYDFCYLTNFNDNWGTVREIPLLWKGQQYKTWRLSPYDLEKRDLNTVSLFELNRGL